MIFRYRRSKSMDEHLLDDLLRQFCDLTTKDEVLEALETSAALLHCIPLLQKIGVSSDQAEKDFRREKVLLNEVPFIPDRLDDSRSQAFLLTLREFVGRMVGRSRCIESAESVYKLILQRFTIVVVIIIVIVIVIIFYCLCYYHCH